MHATTELINWCPFSVQKTLHEEIDYGHLTFRNVLLLDVIKIPDGTRKIRYLSTNGEEVVISLINQA